jgi:hypothetical protein
MPDPIDARETEIDYLQDPGANLIVIGGDRHAYEGVEELGGVENEVPASI